MGDPTALFFEELAARGSEPLLEKSSGTLRFDAEGDGCWVVVVDRGEVTVSEGHAPADCSVQIDKRLLDEIVSGRRNAMAAVLRGELLIEGPPDLMILFQRLFPGPPRQRGPVRPRKAKR